MVNGVFIIRFKIWLFENVMKVKDGGWEFVLVFKVCVILVLLKKDIEKVGIMIRYVIIKVMICKISIKL